PGAFVGMLLGGASPVQAGAVQLFVLVALMAVQPSPGDQLKDHRDADPDVSSTAAEGE
ncbi:ABC transporter permease, partial [Streptomyces buecherae]|uniref:ABC transporter permease n=1 Tax=Streptomyces buecherae TaxID=2763006 RepID=UPI0020B8E560